MFWTKLKLFFLKWFHINIKKKRIPFLVRIENGITIYLFDNAIKLKLKFSKFSLIYYIIRN